MKRFKDFIQTEGVLSGLAKGKTVEDIAKRHKVTVDHINSQIAKGIKVEREHTKNDSAARTIAMDHVYEDPNYYTKLKKMENESAPVNNVGGGQVAGIAPGEAPPGPLGVLNTNTKFTKKDREKKYRTMSINKRSVGWH